MKMIEISQATASLAEYTEQVNIEPVVITIQGQPIAVLLSMQNIDIETISLSMNPQFLKIIEQSRDNQKVKGGISSQQMRQRLGLTSVL